MLSRTAIIRIYWLPILYILSIRKIPKNTTSQRNHSSIGKANLGHIRDIHVREHPLYHPLWVKAMKRLHTLTSCLLNSYLSIHFIVNRARSQKHHYLPPSLSMICCFKVGEESCAFSLPFPTVGKTLLIKTSVLKVLFLSLPAGKTVRLSLSLSKALQANLALQ